MTDKATVTITAPKAGRRGRDPRAWSVRSSLSIRCSSSSSSTASAAAAPVAFERHGKAHARASERRARGHGGRGASRDAAGDGAARALGAGGGRGGGGYFNEKPLATPATRKLASDMEVDLASRPAERPAGRVTRGDVEGFRTGARGAHGARATRRGPPLAPTRTPAIASPRATASRRARAARRRAPADRPEDGAVEVRRRRTSRSSRSATRRAQGPACAPQGAAEARGVKLSFLPFVVKAVVAALKKHPILNTTLDEATQRDRLPQVLPYRDRHGDGRGARRAGREGRRQKSVLEIAREIERLAQEARRARRRPRTSTDRRSPSPRSARKAASSRRPSSTSPRSRSSVSTR